MTETEEILTSMSKLESKFDDRQYLRDVALACIDGIPSDILKMVVLTTATALKTIHSSAHFTVTVSGDDQQMSFDVVDKKKVAVKYAKTDEDE